MLLRCSMPFLTGLLVLLFLLCRYVCTCWYQFFWDIHNSCLCYALFWLTYYHSFLLDLISNDIITVHNYCNCCVLSIISFDVRFWDLPTSQVLASGFVIHLQALDLYLHKLHYNLHALLIFSCNGCNMPTFQSLHIRFTLLFQVLITWLTL